ncbi:MAG TPA: ABC transporter permease subunit [Candidatus Bathyarchaeia archaeon]|jgi:ABC-type nitrate/sulfonate/bicarbonate transport system permease component|nr:ABC transporter permease subunit [Candidatus Bathyarchaeia archaeon]
MLTLVMIFAVWETVSLLDIVSGDQLPALHSVLLTLVQLGGTPFFLVRVGQSFVNVAGGVSLALVIVMPLALLVGLRNQLDEAITPIIMLIGALPDLAILTLLVTVIGRGNVAAVAISAFSAFFPIYFTIRQGVKEIPSDYFHVASVFKARRFDTFSKIILPSIFPNFLTGLRLSFEFSWNVLLAVEIIASVAGVGSFISNSIQGASHSITYGLAAIMTVGLLTVVIDRAFFERLEQRIKRWR